MTVTPFDPNRFKPHTSGIARCVRGECLHEWAAVVLAEKRNDFMECPKCHQETGRYFAGYVPNKQQPRYECDCGNDLLYYLADGRLLCPGCGTYHTP